MLVQKQAPKRIRNLLIGGGIAVVLLVGYVVYVNVLSKSETTEMSVLPPKATVPTDFGQELFRDSRFYALAPKTGTQLITQATATLPGERLPAPKSLQAFDVQTGTSVLFTWEQPTGIERATLIRINEVVSNEVKTNIATLPPTATSFVWDGARTKAQTTYEVIYVAQPGAHDAPRVPAVQGSMSETVTVTRADESGVSLQFTTPPGDYTHVEVYRSTSSDELGARIDISPESKNSHDDETGRAGLYFYTVRWIREVTGGEPATVSVMATDATPPNPPDGVRVSYDPSVQPARMVVTWDPSSSADVAEYRVFRSTQAVNLGSLVATKIVSELLDNVSGPATNEETCKATLCIHDREVQPGTTLYYTVVAVDRNGNTSSTQDISVPGRANPFAPL